jgi:hydrogenase maturation factor HypF (carbamoyltransferase family)
MNAGCPRCDSGWIYVNEHTVDGRRYEQVTACPRCLPQHVTTHRDNEPDRKDLQ